MKNSEHRPSSARGLVIALVRSALGAAALRAPVDSAAHHIHIVFVALSWFVVQTRLQRASAP